MRTWLPYARWALALVMAAGWFLLAGAEDLAVQSFEHNGRLTFNEVSSSEFYRVEWRTNLLTDQWYSNAPGINAVAPSGLGTVSCTVDVSVARCFYRVVASLTNIPGTNSDYFGTNSDYFVVDLSDGPTASNYPVSYLTDVPAGGWTDEYKTTKMVFRRIPAGTFTMGSPDDELGRWIEEVQHEVTLTQPFYVGVCEVTQKQWERVMGTWPSYFNNASYRDARPVEQVSYNMIRGTNAGAGWPTNSNVDADSFMGRLRARTGKAFDLPTEAQWEYAGRAGTTTALNSGKNLTNVEQCPNMSEVGRYWYSGPNTYGYGQSVGTAGGTAKAGSYLPNAWGLYDIHGNVWEWCLDWNGTYPGTASDPKGATTGSYRVLRGGSWTRSADRCRVGHRDFNYPAGVYYVMGFRAALPPGQ